MTCWAISSVRPGIMQPRVNSSESEFYSLAHFHFQPYNQALCIEIDALDATALQLCAALRIAGLQAEVKTDAIVLTAKLFA